MKNVLLAGVVLALIGGSVLAQGPGGGRPGFGGGTGQINLWRGMPNVRLGGYYSTSPVVASQRVLVVGGTVLDNVTTTLDYTYVENKVQQQRSELSVWFNYGPGDSSWTDGPVAAPIIYSEDMTGADLSMGGMQLATKTQGDSLGFNVEWEVSDNLNLEFDYHNSQSESKRRAGLQESSNMNLTT